MHVFSPPSHPSPSPLAVPLVTLWAATLPSHFQENQRKPQLRVSSTRQRWRGESLCMFLLFNRPLSHPPWISMNSKDNLATGKPHRSLHFFHPSSTSVGSHFGTTLCLDHTPLLSSRPFHPLPWEFHSKRTPLCKYARESLLMLPWGGEKSGWSRGGAWLVALASATKPKECVSRICIKPTQHHRRTT